MLVERKAQHRRAMSAASAGAIIAAVAVVVAAIAVDTRLIP